MRESVRIERKIPKFRPLPISLRKRRVTPVERAKFYGNYTTKTGQIKRFSFEIIMPEYINGKTINRMIRLTCQKIKYFKLIPLAKQGQKFTFGELHQRTPWIKVRKIREYKAGMVYTP
jgi:hypothetical protein